MLARFKNEHSIEPYNGTWFTFNDDNYSNPTEEQLAAAGFMEVIEADPGEIEDYDLTYEVVDGHIVQSVIPIVEPVEVTEDAE